MSAPLFDPTAGPVGRDVIAALCRSKLFREYSSVFTKATGLPLALRPLEYWQLAHHGKTNENRFCALLAERPVSRGHQRSCVSHAITAITAITSRQPIRERQPMRIVSLSAGRRRARDSASPR